MRQLRRPAAPKVLQDNAARWTEEFNASGKPRPDSRRYAHKEVKRTLSGTSDNKCFYCERPLLPREGGASVEVDHRRGVLPHELAYDWDNLYLSCDGCNAAKNGRADIAIEDTLDPCDSAVDPTDHLDAHLEFARPHRASAVGKRTIDKLGLNTQVELIVERVRWLQRFERELRLRVGAAAQSRAVSFGEQERIARDLAAEYARPDMPFSWMFVALLRRPGPITGS